MHYFIRFATVDADYLCNSCTSRSGGGGSQGAWTYDYSLYNRRTTTKNLDPLNVWLSKEAFKMFRLCRRSSHIFGTGYGTDISDDTSSTASIVKAGIYTLQHITKKPVSSCTSTGVFLYLSGVSITNRSCKPLIR